MPDEWVVVRLKLQDKARFIADTKAAGISVQELGNQAKRTGSLFQQGAHHGFLWNQMLFTLRRTIYAATLAIGAMGTAAVVAGFRFNSMIEQQTLAFKTMMGSASAARREVTFLFNLAAHGPFQFEQVIQGARQLQAFGYQAGSANKILVALQDAMAGMGLDQAGLDRATLALGEIRSIGVLQGRQVRQLEQLGLLNREVLAKGLGISTQQAGLVGQLQVPWQKAIDIITAYWVKRFHGASRQFQNTWVGLWSTFKDLGSQAMGAITQPLFRGLEGRVRRANPVLQDISNYYGQAGGRGTFTGALGVVRRDTGVNLVPDWRALIFVGKQLASILRTLFSIFFSVTQTMQVGHSILLAVGGALFIVAHALQIMKYPLMVLLGLWIASKTALLAMTAAEYINITATKLYTLWTERAAAATLLMRARSLLFGFALVEVFDRQAGVYKQVRVATGLLPKLSLALRGAAAAAWAFAAPLLANPITWVVLAAAAVLILYWRWKKFRDIVNETIGWLWHHPLVAAIIPVLGPLFVMARTFDHIYNTVRAIWGVIKQPLGFGGGGGHGFSWGGLARGAGHFLGIPGLATGGHVVSGGRIMVGERGPELLTVPAGASVVPLGLSPLASLGAATGGARGGRLELTIPLYLDRRKLAEANASVDLDAMARM